MSSAGVHALIVEDDQSWQQILTEILTDAGLTVDVAEDLETAVAKLRVTHYRLALVDLALDSSDHQNQDGLRVIDAARRQAPGCVSVLLTGFATPDISDRALNEHGASACIRKESFRRSDFRELVSQVLAD